MAKTMLFNPYTGKPRDPRDIASDPDGKLMVDPDEPLRAASKFSCYLQRDHGKAPCDHDCGKLRCMYPSKEASKVEPVAEEPVAAAFRNGTAKFGYATILKALPASKNLPVGRDVLLYLHPAPQALGDDTKRLDWLEKHFTHISGIFLDSLNCVQHFEVDCEEDTLESGTTRIREAIDAAILAAAGGGEK